MRPFAPLAPSPKRGFFIVGFLRVPRCLEEEDWADITAQLEERATDDLARAVVRVAEKAAAKQRKAAAHKAAERHEAGVGPGQPR